MSNSLSQQSGQQERVSTVNLRSELDDGCCHGRNAK